jgi:Skp family chaperone for outer membrane proteins
MSNLLPVQNQKQKNILHTFLVSLCLCAACMLSAALPTAEAHAEELKVGIVDFGRAIQDTEGKREVAKLEKEVNEKKDKLEKLKAEITTKEEELKQNMAMFSEEKKREEVMGLQKKAFEFEQTAMKFEQEMNQKRVQLLGTLQERMMTISVEIAQEKKLDLMLERNEGAVLYFRNTFDFTDELIKRYKAAHP